MFFSDLNTINKTNGFEEFNKNLKAKKINCNQDIIDKNGNILGNFVIFRNIEEIINTNDTNILSYIIRFFFEKNKF